MKQGHKGFTLLELAIVLVIIALVTAMAISSGVGVLATARITATQQRMAAIEQALQSYRAAQNRLPCPASLTIAEGNAGFGVEGTFAGDCMNLAGVDGAPAANYSNGGAAEGAVPTVTLGLPNTMMYDGWGNRFRYAVDAGITASNAFSSIPSGCTDAAITVKNANGSAITSGALYALISHGEDAHGGYGKSGIIFNANSSNGDEQINCHCDLNANATTYAPVYVRKDSVINPGNLSDTFDDMVTYKERWQMMTAWEKPMQCQYVYVVDSGNHRVQKFSLKGTYLGQFGSSGTTDGTFNTPIGIAIDPSGNIFVTDSLNYRVQKFDSSGAFLAKFGSYGSGDGQFGNSWPANGPSGITIDRMNNVYVVDGAGSRVEKFSLDGTYLSQIGSCPSGACSAGSANGQFNKYTGVLTTDANNNLFVNDGDPTHRVQKFNSSGVYQSTLGCLSCSPNNLYGVTALYIDVGNYIWLMNRSLVRIEKYDSNYVKQAIFVGGSDYYGPGANGLFGANGILGIAMDESGNIYASDHSNNRVQVFNSAGVYQRQLGCATGGCTASSANGQFNGPYNIVITTR